MYIADTIAAIATPPGCGGIGIVRVSGPLAEQIALKIFRAAHGGGFQSHRLYYGRIINPEDASLIDEGMAVIMRAPSSYTKEDVLEIHSHGGYLVVRSVLQACVALGARLAEPGEFTRRAFLNGRIDLSQAESVIDIINSRTDASLALAQRQREGALGAFMEQARSQLAEALAILEAHIDFPEDEIDPSSINLISSRINSADTLIRSLLDSFRFGRILREGVSVLLAGKPNAGKSSLLNALASEERAIVSSLPGTTRDMIEEIITINGLPVKIIDAAGIRDHHSDEIEKEGIRRTLGKLAEADLVLYLADGTHPFDDDDKRILSELDGRIFITVVTKADLSADLQLPLFSGSLDTVFISSRTGQNLGTLREMIFDFFMHDAPDLSSDIVAISNVRHRDILQRANASLEHFRQHYSEGLPPEFLAVDLREALLAVGEITGSTTPDDLLDLIFSSFCIGK